MQALDFLSINGQMVQPRNLLPLRLVVNIV